ncbi:MAG: glycosyltransferase family 2 protein [Nanoarchaeota archaeon]|nr:glycosyltransferase family 2 protein [Nanoarchaeota archaeon]MBU1005765.1 glycosyltransferase family 2 protein [Nanoarchaeota archaeon]MBU1946636.1 glycosyltransferase family 2 protein [Nanoarchaeota archaeon]
MPPAPLISVIVIFKNEYKHIRRCVSSILNQSYNRFELILVNDASIDESKNVVRAFNDERIVYCENNESKGIPHSRNIGLGMAKGKYIFFTDADCIAHKTWLEEGLKSLQKGFLGVEGRLVYLSKKPSISDRVVQNLSGGFWPTANMGYAAAVINKIGCFDITFGNYASDRDIAFRVMHHGKICFNKKMIVYHCVKKWNFKRLINDSKIGAVSRVRLIKKHNDKTDRLWRVVLAKHLFGILFPPSVFLHKLLNYRVSSFRDIKVMLYFYPAFIVERYFIWRTAVKERVFLI